MRFPLFDAHCDTLWRLDHEGERLYNNTGHVNLSECGGIEPHARIFALFGDTDKLSEAPQAHMERLLRIFYRELSENGDQIALCVNAGQAEAAAKEGKTAAFLSVEGAELLGCSAEGLRDARSRGVRAVGITWNHANALSGSCREETDRGLGEAGRGFVREMLRMGMLPDVSHLSVPGFCDVAEVCADAGRPFFASHSNAYALRAHPRNLSDGQFKELIRCSGVAGINLYADFLTESETCTLDDVISHIEHFLSLGGEKNVAIGSDFDGCDRLPDGIGRAGDLEKLYERLLGRNYPERLVQDIFYNNLMRVVKRSCDTSAQETAP